MTGRRARRAAGSELTAFSRRPAGPAEAAAEAAAAEAAAAEAAAEPAAAEAAADGVVGLVASRRPPASAAAADRTTTLSPALSPLTTCVVESPTTPVCDPLRWSALPSRLDGDRRAAAAPALGTARPVTCEVTMSAVALMPALRPLARLVEREHRPGS